MRVHSACNTAAGIFRLCDARRRRWRRRSPRVPLRYLLAGLPQRHLSPAAQRTQHVWFVLMTPLLSHCMCALRPRLQCSGMRAPSEVHTFRGAASSGVPRSPVAIFPVYLGVLSAPGQQCFLSAGPWSTEPLLPDESRLLSKPRAETKLPRLPKFGIAIINAGTKSCRVPGTVPIRAASRRIWARGDMTC